LIAELPLLSIFTAFSFSEEKVLKSPRKGVTVSCLQPGLLCLALLPH